MDYNKTVMLYDLLSDFIDYSKQCKNGETNDGTLYEIEKAIENAENIQVILSLEF